jgi:hypothetical protein
MAEVNNSFLGLKLAFSPKTKLYFRSAAVILFSFSVKNSY